ncbi:hypothetical protein LCGC14_2889660 [marine sediment metagenome]|uniref:BLUF domain-containing protein n=1 Tax=marine sediment metagenome TaxID=412755 RepID=A0A0F9ANT0_9ZZZZ|nr:BLUF domain-containing protein [Leeuwenhoekiella sp.]
MEVLHTICYISKANPSLSEDEIQLLFEQVNQCNQVLGITGFLTYSFGRFFQVLEGNPKHILPLFENKIKEDQRHTEIFEVYNRSTPHQVFLKYNSKFKVVTQKEELQNIEKYLLAHRAAENSEKISRLLKPFLFFD